jgi:hypothetical protein
MRWLGGKGVDLHLLGFKINPHEMAWVVVIVGMLIKYSLPT